MIKRKSEFQTLLGSVRERERKNLKRPSFLSHSFQEPNQNVFSGKTSSITLYSFTTVLFVDIISDLCTMGYLILLPVIIFLCPSI